METVPRRGLAGIADDVRESTARVHTPEAAYFERQALGCINAIRCYCDRYAKAAAGKNEMAEALRHVPYLPAYDFYSALQSIWMMQFICSAGTHQSLSGALHRRLSEGTSAGTAGVFLDQVQRDHGNSY